jgi:endonuclease YncB( thermonuclease family)
MMTSILTVRGTLALSQFWPIGLSDADTAHIKVEAVEWEKKGSTKQKVSFEHAIIHGRVTKPVLSKGKITVRLQGLDAPELHFRPTALVEAKQQSETAREKFLRWNFNFRQSLAEQSVLALKELLESTNQEEMPCWVETKVNEISEAFDCYGRFVGDVWINLKGKKLNLNRWILRAGWAFPAFYNSMTSTEIQELIKDSAVARKNKLGVWAFYSSYTTALNWGLQFRKTSEPEETQKVMLPKLFRRLVSSSVNQRAGFFHGNFRQFLKISSDACYLTDDFIKKGTDAKRYTLEDLVLPGGRLEVEPHQFVFCESPARFGLSQ